MDVLSRAKVLPTLVQVHLALAGNAAVCAVAYFFGTNRKKKTGIEGGGGVPASVSM